MRAGVGDKQSNDQHCNHKDDQWRPSAVTRHIMTVEWTATAGSDIGVISGTTRRYLLPLGSPISLVARCCPFRGLGLDTHSSKSSSSPTFSLLPTLHLDSTPHVPPHPPLPRTRARHIRPQASLRFRRRCFRRQGCGRRRWCSSRHGQRHRRCQGRQQVRDAARCRPRLEELCVQGESRVRRSRHQRQIGCARANRPSPPMLDPL